MYCQSEEKVCFVDCICLIQLRSIYLYCVFTRKRNLKLKDNVLSSCSRNSYKSKINKKSENTINAIIKFSEFQHPGVLSEKCVW